MGPAIHPAPPHYLGRRDVVSISRGRLRRLEDRRRGGPCPECGLRQQDNGYIVVDGNDPVPDLPEVCPRCGRNTRLHMVVVYEGEEGEGGLLA